MPAPFDWNFTKRKNLKSLILSGYSIKEVADVFNATVPMIRAELKLGCPDGERVRNILYDPVLATEKLILRKVDEDGLQAVMERRYGKSKR